MQKAKLDNSALVVEVNESEFIDSGLGIEPQHQGHPIMPPVQSGSKGKSQGHMICASLKRGDKSSSGAADKPIVGGFDHSKYLISEANARNFDKQAP